MALTIVQDGQDRYCHSHGHKHTLYIPTLLLLSLQLDDIEIEEYIPILEEAKNQTVKCVKER